MRFCGIKIDRVLSLGLFLLWAIHGSNPAGAAVTSRALDSSATPHWSSGLVRTTVYGSEPWRMYITIESNEISLGICTYKKLKLCHWPHIFISTFSLNSRLVFNEYFLNFFSDSTKNSLYVLAIKSPNNKNSLYIQKCSLNTSLLNSLYVKFNAPLDYNMYLGFHNTYTLSGDCFS